MAGRGAGAGDYFQPSPGSGSYPGCGGPGGVMQGNPYAHHGRDRHNRNQWWDSGHHRDKKKQKKRKYDPIQQMPREEKIKIFFEYLQQRSVDVTKEQLEECFNADNALYRLGLANYWMDCRKMISQQMEADKDGKSLSEQPSAGASLESDLPAETSSSERKHENQLFNLDKLLESAHFVKPQEESACFEWIDMNTKSLGQFFINKVKCNEETGSYQYWKPAHLKTTATCVVSFEELTAPTSDLNIALIVNDSKFEDTVDLIGTMPSSVPVHVVCPMVRRREMPPVPRQTEICPIHSKERATYDSDGELNDVNCGCGQSRTIDIMFPRKNSQIKARILLLRYSDHVRLVIPSCPLSKVGWEHIVQFGWFCDLPIKDDIPDDFGMGTIVEDKKKILISYGTIGYEKKKKKYSVDLMLDCSIAQSNMAHTFRDDLVHLLGCLSAVCTEDILEGVDFSVLSPMVHLITATPGTSKINPKGLQFGLHKMLQTRKSFNWSRNKIKSLCQVYRIGTFDGVNILGDAFSISKPFGSQYLNIMKIIYPSNEVVDKILESHQNTLLESDVAQLYENLERKCQWWPFLHNVDATDLLCHANVLCQYQELSEEDGPSRRLGWIMTGSQTLGYGSWGGTNMGRLPPDHRSYARYELGVMLAPYTCTDIKSGDKVTYAVDLNQVGFHWYEPVPYRAQEAPYTMDNRPGEKLYRCIAALTRFWGDVGYLDEPPLHMPILSNFDRFVEGTEGRNGIRSCFLGVNTARNYGLDRLPQAGTVVEFWAVKSRPKGRIQMEAVKIITIFQSWKEAFEAFGLQFHHDEPALVTPSLKGLFEQDQGPTRGNIKWEPEKPKMFKEILEEHDIKNDEEMDSFWANKWTACNDRLLDPGGYFPHPDEDLDQQYPMATMKIAPDLTWLEKHVTETCQGKFPMVRGPYSLPFLQTSVTARLHKQFPGLPSDVS